VVFRDETLIVRQLLISCKMEARQWHARMPKKDKAVVQSWCMLFDHAYQKQILLQSVGFVNLFNIISTCFVPWFCTDYKS
jgi:hypothetical protein